jgi:hypothetical protein
MIVLGLDQSPSRIGWAMGHPNMDSPTFGVEPLPKCGVEHGIFLAAARTWLTRMIEEHGIADVCCESVFFGKNAVVYAMSAKLIGAIEIVCHDLKITCTEIESDAWRDRFIGFKKAPRAIKSQHKRRIHLKDAAMRACVERNWNVTNGDEAEACGILDYRLACRFPNYSIRGAPLFDETFA